MVKKSNEQRALTTMRSKFLRNGLSSPSVLLCLFSCRKLNGHEDSELYKTKWFSRSFVGLGSGQSKTPKYIVRPKYITAFNRTYHKTTLPSVPFIGTCLISLTVSYWHRLFLLFVNLPEIHYQTQWHLAVVGGHWLGKPNMFLPQRPIPLR